MSSRKRGSTPSAKAKAARAPVPDPLARPATSVPAASSAAAPKIEAKACSACSICDGLKVWWALIFAACCFAMQCTVVPMQGWAWPPNLDLTGQQAKWVLTDKYALGCVVPMLMIAAYLKFKVFKSGSYSVYDRSMTIWWLTNAFFFHFSCDVLSGLYQVMPAMTGLYQNMTKAHYAERWNSEREWLDAVYFLEMVFEAPVALLLVIFYIRKHPARYVLETFAVAVQMGGTVCYYAPPIIKMEPMTSWVGFCDRGFGSVWMFVPFAVLIGHCRAAVRAEAEKAEAKKA